MILIVEDHPHIRKFLSINLRARGYRIRETASGAAALEMIHEQIPALVLLDIRLPDLDGWEVLHRLEETRVFRFPVILVTALAPTLSEPWRDFPRITHVLYKPIEANRLVAVVKEALNLSPSTESYARDTIM